MYPDKAPERSIFARIPAMETDHLALPKTPALSIEIPELPMVPSVLKVENKLPRSIMPEDEKKSLVPEPAVAVELTKKETDALKKAKKTEEDEQKFRFYFEEATLPNLVKYVEELLHVTFLADDAITPLLQGGGTLQGQKITFKTNKPLTRKEVWDLFTRLLDLAGLAVVPGPTKDFYRITSSLNANKEPIATYFNTPISSLPTNPTKVRYIYFVKHSPIATVQNVATALASPQASIKIFPDLDALVVTDRADNIRSLMEIIQEFDKTVPEALSVLKLRRTSAVEVKELYDKLTTGEGSRAGARYVNQRKQPTSSFFPTNVRLIPEPRTNALVILGPKRAVERVENFIITHVDTELQMPYSPLHVYDLQNTDATMIAKILTNVISFGKNDAIGQYGGIRDGEKYFDSVQITPEPVGNKLIIKADDCDFNHLKKIIAELDIDQPQVAIEILIVDVQGTTNKQMGVQLRNKTDGSLVKNVNFQSSTIDSVITDQTTGSVLGNLIGLASGAAGSTIVSVGNTASGVWGLFKMLNTVTNSKIVDNPFLVTTNNYPAYFKYGNTRQVVEATVGNASSYTTAVADLTINITPQINSEGTVLMDIKIDINDFVNESQTDANTIQKSINTSALVRDQEVVVLGGITKNKVLRNVRKTPFLGDLPIIGNLFRSKTKNNSRSNLLIFISPKILSPARGQHHTDNYTHQKSEHIKETMAGMEKALAPINRDVIARNFFNANEKNSESYLKNINDFITPDETESEQQEKDLKSEPKKTRRASRTIAARTKRLSRKGDNDARTS